MGPPSSEVTEFEEENFLLHVYPPCAILKFLFWLKTPNLAILAMFEVPKPMMEIASRDHIMFFLGLRPIAFGPKFISNYSKTKNGDRHPHGTPHGTPRRRDWKCAGGAEPPEWDCLINNVQGAAWVVKNHNFVNVSLKYQSNRISIIKKFGACIPPIRRLEHWLTILGKTWFLKFPTLNCNFCS